MPNKPLGQNKTIGNIAERLVMRELKKQGLNPKKADAKNGYDIKAGKFIVEVKGTENLDPSFFLLSKEEFHTACKNKNYRLYWVNTKRRKIIKILSQKDVLEHSNVYIGYRLYLSSFKKVKD